MKPLSAREREVIQAAAYGLRSVEVARGMGISVHTLRSHREAAMRRLGAHTLAQAVAIAIRQGVIE